MPIEAAPTVRESLVAAMETVETPPVEKVEQPPVVETAPETVTAPTETEAQKADRLRDEKGRFVEGKAPEKQKAEATPAATILAAPPKPKVPRPSSWKKELEAHWDTLPPEVQSYVGQREREYATGVSTYKNEADRAKDVMTVLTQFEPALQQHGVPVTKWLQDMGNAHHTLALGAQPDKVQMVARIIQGYSVDAQALYQVLSGQQPQYKETPAAQQPAQPQQPRMTEKEIEKVVEQKMLSERAATEYKAFSEAKDEHGNQKYQYLEDVKGTMAGLLQADLSQDYPSAYDAALRHPRHANIWEAMQKQQAEQKEAERVTAAKATATRARSQAVSVKSSTPTAMAHTEGNKGLRETLSETYDSVTARRV